MWAIIGSNCFTGSHIVDALLDDPGNCVVGISRSPEYRDLFLPYRRHRPGRFEFHQIDLVKRFDSLVELLEQVRPAVVVNVAALSEVALSNERPVEYFEVNATGVVRLCNYLRTSSYLQRYVHISSAEIFGSCDTPVEEGAAFHPSTPYAVSKAAADLYLAVAARNLGFQSTIVRSTNVYGAHQQLFKIVPRSVIYLKLGRIIELHGGGRAMKSFIHIRDVVRGLQLAVDREPGTYHFTSRSDDTVADVVRRICELMGHDFDRATRMVGERPGQDARYWLDASKSRRELGWEEQVAFDAGLREVIAWVDGNWDVIQREPLTYQHQV